MRFLSSLVYVSWGALAVIQALHGWNGLAVACMFVALVVLIFSRRPLAGESGAPVLERLINKAISFGLMLLCIGIWFVMRVFPMPLAYACWAGATALVPVVLLYSPEQDVRLGTLGATGFISGAITFMGAGCLLTALDDPGGAFGLLAMLPAKEMQIALICAIAAAPISLAAASYEFLFEVTGQTNAAVQIRSLFAALRRGR